MIDNIKIDNLLELSVVRIGDESTEDTIWDFGCFVDTMRAAFGRDITLSDYLDNNHQRYKNHKYKLMKLLDRGHLYLIKKKIIGGSVTGHDILGTIGVLAIVPNAVEHRGTVFTYIKYFGLVRREQGNKFGKKILEAILDKYPNCLIHVPYPQNDAMDSIVDFHYDCGFKSRYTLIVDDHKNLLMSTKNIVTLDEYMENERNLYPVLKDLEDKLQEI